MVNARAIRQVGGDDALQYAAIEDKLYELSENVMGEGTARGSLSDWSTFMVTPRGTHPAHTCLHGAVPIVAC